MPSFVISNANKIVTDNVHIYDTTSKCIVPLVYVMSPGNSYFTTVVQRHICSILIGVDVHSDVRDTPVSCN